ncbi:MAG TPA: DNA alkylation repair protein [Anaerolineales bacterium]|nr:DNA alkylation repair protein [Anaerolineales bacterium]
MNPPYSDPQDRALAILADLRLHGDPAGAAGMARFAIRGQEVLGVKIPILRKMAKEIGRDHQLAQALWETGVHEVRLLAGFIDDPKEVGEAQMEAWVLDFDSWDVCDQVVGGLFDKTDLAFHKAHEWSRRDEEFVKRAGFVMMASLAVHDKKALDEVFLEFLPVIVRESIDERNFVKKAVNWALRQIGKRNPRLRRSAIETAEQIRMLDSKAARWIAADALRELTR